MMLLGLQQQSGAATDRARVEQPDRQEGQSDHARGLLGRGHLLRNLRPRRGLHQGHTGREGTNFNEF